MRAYAKILTQSTTTWMIFLDNVDDDGVFRPDSSHQPSLDDCLPQSDNGSVLVTSRDMRVAGGLCSNNCLLSIDVMEREEAVHVLVVISFKGIVEESYELLEELDYLLCWSGQDNSHYSI